MSILCSKSRLMNLAQGFFNETYYPILTEDLEYANNCYKNI